MVLPSLQEPAWQYWQDLRAGTAERALSVLRYCQKVFLERWGFAPMQETFYAMLRHRRAGTGRPQKACRAGCNT